MLSAGIVFRVGGLGQAGCGFLLSHAVSLQCNAVGVVDDAVEDGIGDGGFADQVVPLGDGHLGGDQGLFTAVAFLADFQEIEPLAIVEAMGSPVIENQELNPGELVDQSR